MSTKTEATIEDLYKVDGKAELVNGEIVLMSPTGGKPSMAARAIVLSLYEYERRTKSGYAVTDNAAFKVNLPHRKSFSPDAAFYEGGEPTMKFFEGAPVFAVESASPEARASPVAPESPLVAPRPVARPVGPEAPDVAVGLVPAPDCAQPVFPVLVAEDWALTSPELPETAVGTTVTSAAPPAPPLASARAIDSPPAGFRG